MVNKGKARNIRVEEEQEVSLLESGFLLVKEADGGTLLWLTVSS